MLQFDFDNLPQLMADLDEYHELFRGVTDVDLSVSVDALGSVFEPWANSRNTAGETPIQRAHRQIAAIYNSEHAFISTGGTTATNKLALFTLLNPGDEVLVERDCHVSMIQALNEIGAEPVWLMPRFDEDLGINLASSPTAVQRKLKQHPKIRAAVFTSPKYYGVVGDIAGCVGACHKHGIPVLVDEAHGDCLPFCPDKLPASATSPEVAADIVTISTHKSTHALAQGSVLLINGRALKNTSWLRRRFLHALLNTPTISTSFSYPIFASVQVALFELALGSELAPCGEDALSRAVHIAETLRKKISAIRESGGPPITTWGAEQADLSKDEFRQLNPLRVTVDVSKTGLAGFRVVELMQDPKHCANQKLLPFVAELGDLKNILILVRPGMEEETLELIERHLRSLPEDASARPLSAPPVPRRLPERDRLPRDAFWAVARQISRNPNAEPTKIEQAADKVSGQTIGVYPPGNTIIAHGEILSDVTLRYLRTLAKHGAHLRGTFDENFAEGDKKAFAAIYTLDRSRDESEGAEPE